MIHAWEPVVVDAYPLLIQRSGGFVAFPEPLCGPPIPVSLPASNGRRLVLVADRHPMSGDLRRVRLQRAA